MNPRGSDHKLEESNVHQPTLEQPTGLNTVPAKQPLSTPPLSTPTPPARLVCYDNGRRLILPVTDAWQRLWSRMLAWLLPPDKFRFSHWPHGDWAILSQYIPPRARLTMETLLTRGRLATTYDDLRDIDETLVDATDGAINRRVKLISDVFPPDMKPLDSCDVTDDGRVVSGYRPREAFTWFIISSVDPSCGIRDADFEWEFLEAQPRSSPAD